MQLIVQVCRYVSVSRWQVYERMDFLGWTDGWIDGWMDGWRHGGMEAWRHGGMDVWMHVRICVSMYLLMYGVCMYAHA